MAEERVKGQLSFKVTEVDDRLRAVTDKLNIKNGTAENLRLENQDNENMKSAATVAHVADKISELKAFTNDEISAVYKNLDYIKGKLEEDDNTLKTAINGVADDVNALGEYSTTTADNLSKLDNYVKNSTDGVEKKADDALKYTMDNALEIQAINTDLGTKANKTDLNSVAADLANVATDLSTHNHDDLYSKLTHDHDDVYALKEHDHGNIYAAADHTHDNYANKSHTHTSYATKSQAVSEVKISDSGELSYVNALGDEVIVGKLTVDSIPTFTIAKDLTTNINGRQLSNFTATREVIQVPNGDGTNTEYVRWQIKYKGAQATEANARLYMKSMTGSDYLPVYNYEVPKNAYILLSDGLIVKPQFESAGFYL